MKIQQEEDNKKNKTAEGHIKRKLERNECPMRQRMNEGRSDLPLTQEQSQLGLAELGQIYRTQRQSGRHGREPHHREIVGGDHCIPTKPRNKSLL